MSGRFKLRADLPRLPTQVCVDISDGETIGALKTIEGNAGAGREVLERELFGVSVGDDGWPIVGTRRRAGRPPDKAWVQLAETGFEAWKHMSGDEPSVTVDPIAEPVSRSSKAAKFVARLLDLAADRLPPESPGAVAFRQQEARLIGHLEVQRRSGQLRGARRKRTKSSP